MNADNLASLLAYPEPLVPSIIISPRTTLVDAPDTVRWRARWDKAHDGRVAGIALQAFPVIKRTPAGAWIDPEAWLGWENDWQLSGQKRWVSDFGAQAWAKPTQKEALDSIAVRYNRWAARMAQDIDYFLMAGEALKTLFPDRTRDVETLAQMIARTAEVRK